MAKTVADAVNLEQYIKNTTSEYIAGTLKREL